jgi:hypothetical protein
MHFGSGYAAQDRLENAMELVEDKIRARFQVDISKGRNHIAVSDNPVRNSDIRVPKLTDGEGLAALPNTQQNVALNAVLSAE